MGLVRFRGDDPAGLWRAGDVAEDLGWESQAVPVRLLRLHRTGETLSISEPLERGLVEPIPTNQTEGHYDLFVNAERTILFRHWPESGVAEVALRDSPAHTWGPPIRMERERT